MKIMAVDDERGALKILTRAIKQVVPDAEIYDFGDPADALEWFVENNTDVAFLDIQMPEISGPELAVKIKEISPDTKVIFETGFLEGENEKAAAVADGFVMKPATKHDVEKALGVNID